MRVGWPIRTRCQASLRVVRPWSESMGRTKSCSLAGKLSRELQVWIGLFMVDILTPEQRSARMRRVRQTGTDIELRLRRALWAASLRYRIKMANSLPGRPDVVFVTARIAVFVDGCFWHGCPLHGTRPVSNAIFWAEKIRRNQQRDRQVDEKLSAAGWRVIRLWEHEVKKDLAGCVSRIRVAIQTADK
ncbi:very short patch repair endonuclease [Burkholderia ubonensis]|uniref:very short patch repair endonuclease n=2 Tax=Burkholderiaceae TaxID=119060 RepID=UPI002FC7DF4E